MRILIGALAAVLVALGAATGVTVVLSNGSAPDKNVNLDDVHQPDPWSNTINYGSR